MRFRERIASFFWGRYGTDALSKFVLVIYVLLAALMLFVRSSVLYYVLQAASLALCFWIFFRMLSRNISARQAENERFLKIKKGAREKLFLQRNKWKYRKTHIYRKCPNCRVSIKLRRISGDHKCACPRCGKRFDVHVK